MMLVARISNRYHCNCYNRYINLLHMLQQTDIIMCKIPYEKSEPLVFVIYLRLQFCTKLAKHKLVLVHVLFHSRSAAAFNLCS